MSSCLLPWMAKVFQKVRSTIKAKKVTLEKQILLEVFTYSMLQIRGV